MEFSEIRRAILNRNVLVLICVCLFRLSYAIFCAIMRLNHSIVKKKKQNAVLRDL